jgi:predicted N-acetyltransferase YhbS
MTIQLRAAVSGDAAACGRIIFRAFQRINDEHGFPSAYTDETLAARVASTQLDHPEVYGVVAEADGHVVGSAFLDERALVLSIGPVTVDPPFQRRGIGRRMMEHLLQRAGTAPGARLTTDAFNPQAISLYTSLGFEVKEPLMLLTGRPKDEAPTDARVRPMTADDLEATAALSAHVHGFDRSNELSDCLGKCSPVILVKQGRPTAYASTLSLWQAGHGVAETDQDLQALILGAASLSASPISLLLPTRQSTLLRWCVHQGLRLGKPMLLMSIGEYQEPRGAWFPSARM